MEVFNNISTHRAGKDRVPFPNSASGFQPMYSYRCIFLRLFTKRD